MLIRRFNRAWEKERDIIEAQLADRLDTLIAAVNREIASIRADHLAEDKRDLYKLRDSLQTRKALLIFEAEEIARHRMQMRVSYLAFLMSSIALLVSVVAVLSKI